MNFRRSTVQETMTLFLCLPHHTTKYLQPLARTFSSPWKSITIKNILLGLWLNKIRKITRLRFRGLLGTLGKSCNQCKCSIQDLRRLECIPYTEFDSWLRVGVRSAWCQHVLTFNITNKSVRWCFNRNNRFRYPTSVLYLYFSRPACVVYVYPNQFVSVFNACLSSYASSFYVVILRKFSSLQKKRTTFLQPSIHQHPLGFLRKKCQSKFSWCWRLHQKYQTQRNHD